jgi:hypothetical protein
LLAGYFRDHFNVAGRLYLEECETVIAAFDATAGSIDRVSPRASRAGCAGPSGVDIRKRKSGALLRASFITNQNQKERSKKENPEISLVSSLSDLSSRSPSGIHFGDLLLVADIFPAPKL